MMAGYCHLCGGAGCGLCEGMGDEPEDQEDFVEPDDGDPWEDYLEVNGRKGNVRW